MTHSDMPEFDHVKAAWNTVATYSDYDAAQAAVERLAGEGFPIENLDIVGSDVRLIERVTGRMTRGRSIGNGTMNGAVLGLFIGLLLGLFSPGFAWLGLAVVGLVIGATWGAAFGYAAHAPSRTGRDFISARRLVAARYDIVVRGGLTERARAELSKAGLLPTS